MTTEGESKGYCVATLREHRFETEDPVLPYRHYPTDTIEQFARPHLLETVARLGFDVGERPVVQGLGSFGEKLDMQKRRDG